MPDVGAIQLDEHLPFVLAEERVALHELLEGLAPIGGSGGVAATGGAEQFGWRFVESTSNRDDDLTAGTLAALAGFDRSDVAGGEACLAR